jgi:CRISPR-associated protein Csm3
MFKISYNRAVLRFRLETVTPLSIRAGETGLDPTGSDLVCVRTHHRAHGSTVYIPGSSLKGVIRSAAEASLRSKRFTHLGGGRIEGACDPADHQNSCAKHGSRSDNSPDTARVHRENCAACRLFGSLSIRGRCAIRDLFPFAVASGLSEDDRSNLARANQVEVRNGVFISRISGSVAVGPFDQEMIPAGTHFHGEVALQNYQVWQLGLLSSAFGELSDGFVQLGSSKTRGLGVVRIEFQSLIHEQRAGVERRPLGAGDLVDDGNRRAYGLFAERPLPPSEGTPRGLSRRFVADGPAETESWTTAGLGALSDLLSVAQGGE